MFDSLRTSWSVAFQASLYSVFLSFPKFMIIELVMLSLLLLPFALPLPSIFPSIGFFSNELALCIRWLKYESLSFSNSPSNTYSGSISFRVDWFYLLAVQRTLKSLLQHHNLKASILQCSAFFMDQLSYPYMTTGKIMALTIHGFVGQITSLLLSNAV